MHVAGGEPGHKANYCPKRQVGNQKEQIGQKKYNNNGVRSKSQSFNNNRFNNTQAGNAPPNGSIEDKRK